MDSAETVLALLHTVLETYSAGAITVFDTECRYAFVGGEGLALVSLSAEAMIGLRPDEVFPAPTGQAVRQQYERCLAGETFTEEVTYQEHTYKVSHRAVRSAEGQILAGVVVTVDVTAQRAEHARRTLAEARYHTLVQNFPGATFLFDGDSRYLLAGGRALEELGYALDRFEGRTPTEALGDGPGAFVEGLLRRAREEGALTIDAPGGVDQLFEVRVVPVQGTETVVAMTVDVTEQRRAQRRAEEDLARQDALLREVHHRVKNHLQVVQSLLGMTARRVESEVARRSLRDVRSRVQAMSMVHSELYRHPSEVSLRVDTFLERLLSQLRRGLPGLGGVECAIRLQPIQGPHDVALNLGLVLTELVSNAAEHAYVERSGGWLEVGLTLRDDVVELVVADDGPGMDQHDPQTGSSMGLWLVRTLTAPLGGSVDQEDGDVGVRWRVGLPVDAQQVTAVPVQTADGG